MRPWLLRSVGSSWDAVASPFARSRYYNEYRTVELQNTFYDLPSLEYADKLREEAPEDFHWNMKAWQALTHPPTSPTWRRARRRPQGEPSNIGLLRPTRENLEAWKAVREFAERLAARVVVLQTPPSLKPGEEQAKWIDKFFEMIRGDYSFAVGWEPRGGWNSEPELLRRLVCRHNIIHIVDPLRWDPVTCNGQRILYFRLHGRGGREVNYRYRYTDEDLEELARRVAGLLEQNNPIERVYVMFNNVYMAEDSRRFRRHARRMGLDAC